MHTLTHLFSRLRILPILVFIFKPVWGVSELGACLLNFSHKTAQSRIEKSYLVDICQLMIMSHEIIISEPHLSLSVG